MFKTQEEKVKPIEKQAKKKFTKGQCLLSLWNMSIISAVWKREDCEFKASLIENPDFQTKQTKYFSIFAMRDLKPE